MNERDFHDHYYESEAAEILQSPLFNRARDRVARQFLRATETGRALRVLSLGCGEGSLERRLAPHVGEIVGVDISAVAIEQAKAQSGTAGFSNLSFHVSDLSRPWPEGLGQFDVIAAFAFLHHLDDEAVRATLLAARQALRPGGAFYSTDPNRRRLLGLFSRLVGKAYVKYHSPDEHEIVPEALAAVAVAAGFPQPVISYTDFFLGPVAWVLPRTPRGLVPLLEAVDNLILAVPLLKRYSSSISMLARVPSSAGESGG